MREEAMRCPECGGEAAATALAVAICRTCGHTFGVAPGRGASLMAEGATPARRRLIPMASVEALLAGPQERAEPIPPRLVRGGEVGDGSVDPVAGSFDRFGDQTLVGFGSRLTGGRDGYDAASDARLRRLEAQKLSVAQAPQLRSVFASPPATRLADADAVTVPDVPPVMVLRRRKIMHLDESVEAAQAAQSRGPLGLVREVTGAGGTGGARRVTVPAHFVQPTPECPEAVDEGAEGVAEPEPSGEVAVVEDAALAPLEDSGAVLAWVDHQEELALDVPQVAVAALASDGVAVAGPWRAGEEEGAPASLAALAEVESDAWTLGDSSAVVAEVVPMASGASWRILPVAAAVLLLVAALAFVVWGRWGGGVVSGAGDAPVVAEAMSPMALARAAAGAQVRVALALALARTQVHVALAVEEKVAERLARDAWHRYQGGDLEAAAAGLEAAARLGLGRVEHFHTLAMVYMDLGRYAEARATLYRVREARHPDTEGLLWRSFGEDGRFVSPVHTVGPTVLDSISPLGGGSTLTFRFHRGGETVAAFKPLQTRRQSNYRSEIASWRLCELLRCAFAVPYNREVRIAEPDFQRLYYGRANAKHHAYAEGFGDLIWSRDGNQRYLYGTEKAWVSDFTRFPIEMVAMWSPWLLQSADASILDVALSDSLRAWRNDPEVSKSYGRFMIHAGDMGTRELARQVSEVLVFDYLVGNWDRFSGVKAWWGVNCQFAEGRIVSIDNGAAFQPYANDRVRSHFDRVERFSRSFIRELRLLNKEAARAFLFPEASRREADAFEQFWTQRAQVLAKVDTLIEQYGEEAVLVFE